MSLPPFPSQDLAKLVLGYLAEEQLMTAYDEFLQGSPYLDALRNEYDRIFMTSLKSILAEYRAVKIYVDTCKPFVLRKKIFQCTNLLEIFKFLIANVDIKKIQQQESVAITSTEKQNVTVVPQACELCNSLSLLNCVCKNQATDVAKPDVNYAEASSLLQNSVEATPLADLPGNYATTRKKHMKTLDTQINSNISSLQNSDSSAKQSFSNHLSPEEYLARCESSPTLNSDETSLTINVTAKAVEPTKSTRNIEEFNNVLKSVVIRNKTLSNSESSSNQIISKAGTFQDFSSGVSGGESHSATYNVPDSSTSENLNVRAPITKNVYNDNIKGPPQQLMLQVNHVNDAFEIQTCKAVKPTKLLPKTLERQIQILSDVKVDNKLHDKINCKKKKTKTAINATSTPIMHMKTIMINGTPAYKHTPNTHTFTKDEIMAMPTLIVVPASGPSQIPTSAPCNPIMAPNTSIISNANNSPRVLGPLVIDVPPNTVVTKKSTLETLPDLGLDKPVTDDLVKTVDVKCSNGTAASVPKDNVISLQSNTPQVLPPLRKSSSTPRRSSHIRVLDFTTPRRILHETINEVPVQTCPPVEVVSGQSVESSQTTASETMEIKSEIIVVVKEESNHNDTGSAKENETANKAVKAKKYDWDADLRALVANEKPGNVSHRKPKPKTSKKKKSIDKAPTIKVTDSKKKTRKQSPRVKKAISRNVEELEDEPIPSICTSCDVPCKPNIKIICGDKYDTTTTQVNNSDSSSTKNKPQDKVDEYIETPEAERLSLQNVIGAKLNISDFLETPYKQALYDIQMETPKFLGPELPDLPLSNVKITDIPTPRFLNTPNFAQATPSSYSSRPTDYSSGGSYYKPDDQDYIPIPDFLTCPVTSSSKEDADIEKAAEKDSEEKKSRPVRQCAKNVSYYRHSGAVKTKDVEDNVDAALSCSGTASANSSFELKSRIEITDTKTPRAKSQTNKSESRKKNSSSKKMKTSKDSALKDKTKTFMKIKPKCTPKKDTPARNRKQLLKSPYSKRSPHVLPGKKTTSKDKLVNFTSLTVPAATKSRRKSSTPRKLHCTKSFDPEDSHDSSTNILNTKSHRNLQTSVNNTHDSDTEQLALRWSDEGSLDDKLKDSTIKPIGNVPEDINKIQEFIVSTGVKNINDGTLQQDLMKRGFDLETAKIIERDLLDDIPMHAGPNKPISVHIVNTKENELTHEKTSETRSNTNKLLIAPEKSDDDEETELSVHECNEDTNNYFVFKHDDTKEIDLVPPIKFKDNYCAEICIEDVTVKLRLTPFRSILDYDPLTVDEIDYSYKETEQAVNSISGMDRLYTPLKDSYKSQCFEIFDSTLTSIDTPLKTTSPVRNDCNVSVTELVLEESQKAEHKIYMETKNLKRARSSSNESANSSKRTKPDADLLLKAANIQNIDIETVLTKLHGH